jgi:hypothetical protein
MASKKRGAKSKGVKAAWVKPALVAGGAVAAAVGGGVLFARYLWPTLRRAGACSTTLAFDDVLLLEGNGGSVVVPAGSRVEIAAGGRGTDGLVAVAVYQPDAPGGARWRLGRMALSDADVAACRRAG